MVHIGILGYGVVGSGIVRVLSQNHVHIEKKAGQAVVVKRVLDIRDFPGDPVMPLLTHNYADILQDDDIQIVAEVMGGVEPAYTYVKQALMAGKHVCTSNKELVVRHGAELLALAKERELNFLFEASVGGGIPIVRPMNLALTTDEIVSIAGILNGTTNYMLTHMSLLDKSYAEALTEAQELGYAEKNPAADVEGYDACRKLAILLSLATGRQIDYQDIHTEGITALEKADFAFARAFGYSIKLMVDGRITPTGEKAGKKMDKKMGKETAEKMTEVTVKVAAEETTEETAEETAEETTEETAEGTAEETAEETTEETAEGTAEETAEDTHTDKEATCYVEALVAPMLTHHRSLFSNITDVFNGVLVQARVTDDIMFVGRGAGRLPTAGAVVSDIVDISKHLHRHIMHSWSPHRLPVAPLAGYVKSKLIRIRYTDREKALAALRAAAAETVMELPDYPDQMAFITQPEPEEETVRRKAALAKQPGIAAVAAVLRIYKPVEMG